MKVGVFGAEVLSYITTLRVLKLCMRGPLMKMVYDARSMPSAKPMICLWSNSEDSPTSGRICGR